jgi:hypothetical protein
LFFTDNRGQDRHPRLEADLIGAARVFFSLSNIAERLTLPEGHRVEIVAAADHRQGLVLTIIGEGLPVADPFDPPHSMTAETYFAGGGHRPDPQPQEYTPVKAVVTPSDPKRWPRFPGEELNATGDGTLLDPKKTRLPFFVGTPENK